MCLNALKSRSSSCGCPWDALHLLPWLGAWRAGAWPCCQADSAAQGCSPQGCQPGAGGTRSMCHLVSTADNGRRKLSLPRRHTGRILSSCHDREKNLNVKRQVFSELHPKYPPKNSVCLQRGDWFPSSLFHTFIAPLFLPLTLPNLQLFTRCCDGTVINACSDLV